MTIALTEEVKYQRILKLIFCCGMMGRALPPEGVSAIQGIADRGPRRGGRCGGRPFRGGKRDVVQIAKFATPVAQRAGGIFEHAQYWSSIHGSMQGLLRGAMGGPVRHPLYAILGVPLLHDERCATRLPHVKRRALEIHSSCRFIIAMWIPD